ncbi:MAG: hypothetical protein BroJett038_25720 [Chloroflexota bacterium]|nr:MAG: hypothetical protein BroJett038_25720 [Chloroflexota bacterium]
MKQRFPLNWRVMSAASAVLLAVMALLTVAGGPAFAVQAQGGYLPTNSITVSGSGLASGSPDVAYINLGVDSVNASVSQAVAQANQTMAAIMQALTALGVAAEDVQTVSFNVYPEDRYDPQTNMPTGERVYRVNNMLNVTVRDINRVSEVIQAGLDAGATSINSLNFGIANTTDLEQEARLKAVEDARARAERLAAAMGVTLGQPIIISEGMAGGAVPQMFAAMGRRRRSADRPRPVECQRTGERDLCHRRLALGGATISDRGGEQAAPFLCFCPFQRQMSAFLLKDHT